MTPRTILTTGFTHNNQKLAMKFSFDLSRGNHKTVHDWLTKGSYYEPDLSLFFMRVLKHGDTAIDIGANLGAHSMMMSKLVGSHGRVLSFEPDPTNIADFKTNVALNKLENVTLHEMALASTKSTVKLFSAKSDGGWTAVETGATEAFSKDVHENSKEGYNFLDQIQADTLDNFALNKKIKVTKIDVEGYEGKILDGAKNVLKAGGCDYWVVEYAAHCLEHYGEDQWTIRKRFTDHGYDCFIMPRTGTLPLFVPRETKIVSASIINLLFAKTDRIGRDFADATVNQFAYATNIGA